MALDGSGRGLEGNPLGLALGFVEGTALVTLSDRVLADGVRLLALELALAEVEFPLDLQGGAEEFQRRSTRLGYLALEVETRAVAAALDAALAAQDRALRDVRLTADGGRWVLEGTLGPKGPPVAADVWVGPAAGEGLEVHVHDVRVFGPSALCGVGVPRDVEVGLREVLARLGRRDADAVLTQGASVFSFDPVGALLWALLPVHGWKVPIHEGVAIRKVAFTPQGNLQILVGESTAGHVPPPAEAISEASVMAARARADAERLLPAVEAQVSAGALPAAFSVLRDALEEGSERALELLLSVGAADRSLFGATVDLAADQLTVEPDHVAARLAMAVVAEAEARPDDAREHYEQAGRALRRAGRRRRAGLAYRAAARVAAEGSAEQARLLEETIALRPDDPWALEGLVRVLPGLGRATAAVRAARRLASLAPDPETRLVAHLAAGRLLFEQVEDPVGARRELERALKLAPEHPEALEGLARAARLQGEPRRAATILERLATQAERAGDNLRASRLSLELGDLWQGLDPDAAQARYRKALALAPHTARPRLALVEAALAAGRPGDALEVVDEAVPHLDRISAPEERPAVATLRRLAARLYTEAGDREADAVAQLEALLKLDPTHSDSLEALTELYTARGDRAQAVELLSRRAKRAVEAGEPGQAAALYARCHEALAHDPDAQADLRFLVREATERFRTHRALLDLRVALDKEAGDPDAWAAALDRRLLLDDLPEVRAGLWAELGRALEAAERPADAIRAYEEALGGAGAGDKQSALRLVHLYRARADEARLESALERAARLEEGPLARAALFAERARILFNRGEEGEAWASMQEALHETPDDLVLLPFATSLALKAGDAARARNLVEDRLRLLAREPAEARLSAYVDLASVEEISGDRAAVVEALEAAYEAADPQSDRGRRLADRLARELEALEDHARLAKLMRARGQQEQAPAAERAGWRLEAARLFARMEADEDAEAEVRAVLALADAGGVEPHHAEAALDVLDTVAARDPDPTRQARALALRAVRTGGAEGEALRVEASARFEAAGRLDDAIEILEGADTLLAVSPPMLERLGALCTRAGQADRAAWAFGQAARLVTEADGAPAAVALHGQAAEACATTGDLDTARVHDRVVLGAAESGARWLPPALTRLEAHARTVADHELLSEVLGRQAEGAGPDDAARLLLEKADLHLATPGQDRAGLVALRRAHDLAPPDSEIADYVDARLTGALERMGLYAEQAAVLSAWADRAPTSVDRARLLHRAAEVYAGRLRDRSMALSRAQAAVRADPTLPEARALRIDLLRAEGRTDALAEALAEEAAQSADGEQAAARWLEAAELVAPPHHVADAPLDALERALGLVRRAATAAPSDLRPVEAEIRYIRALERSDEELSALGRLVERLPEGPAKVAVNLRRAHLLRGALGDDVAAYMELVSAQDGLQELDEAGLERVLEALPRASHEAYGIEHGDDLVPAVLRAGLDLTERLEDWPSHARYLLALVDETESAAERAQLRVRAGEVLEWRLGDGEGAEREYLTALATDPEHLEARRALSQFYVAVDRFGDLAESLGVEALVEVFESFTDKEPARRIIAAAEALWPVLPEGSSERADVQLRLARTYEGQGADDEGVHILEKVVQTAPRPHRAEAMERLMRLFERQERFDLYCDVLRRKAEHFETDRERAQTLAELGEALEWRLGDGQAAEAEYRAALAADPHCVAARRGLSELLSSQDRFTEVGRDVGRDALRAVMDGLLEQGSRDRERAFAAASALAEQSDEGARGRLWLHVADALEVGPDDETARQREALEAAAESPSSRGAALSRLGNLLRRVGDRAALVEVLARRAEHAESNQEQIDLHFERIRILDEAAAAGELGSTEAEERVEAALGRILAVAPDHPDARARKAALLAEQERWPELVALAGVQALLPHQTAARAAGDRAMVAAIIEERARAERGPAKAELLVELVGFTDLERGAAGDVPRDAEGLYQAALEAQPDFAPAQEGLRAHLESEGRFKEIGTRVSPEALRETVRGLKRLDQAAQLLPATLALAAVLEADPAAGPERVRLFAEAAALHLSEQDEEAAEHALRQALALDPEQPEARHELTELLVRQDRLHDLADVDLSLVAQVATDASTAGDVDREIAALRVLAARREGNARADTLVLVAALEKDRGGAAAAEADLLAALAEDPEHGLARAELESILWAADRLPDALERLGPEAFLRRASMLADGEPAHMIAALDAVQENLQGAAAAEAYQMRAGVRLPDDDDWSRRAEALERAKAAWDALGDAQGSLQSRMAMVDLVRERDDEGALLAALGDALAHAEAPEDRAALAMEQAALLALLERPAEARALVEPLVGDAAVPLAHRRAAARLLADDLISRDLDALDLADLELRGQALEVLTTGGPEPEALDGARWLEELSAVREVMGAESAHIAEPLEAALARLESAETGLRIRKRLQGLYEEMGDWRRAEAHAAHVAEAEGAPEAWVGLSELRAWLDDRDGAESALRRALDLDPSHGPAHASLLRLAEQSGDLGSVIQQLQTWADVDEDGDPEARLLRVLRALEMAAEAGEAGQAEALAERAIGIAPAGRAAEVAQTACRHLAALELTEAQVNLLTRALSLEPRAPAELRLTLAELLVGLDRADEARTAVEAGIHRDTPEEHPLVAWVVADADTQPDDRAARRLMALAERLRTGPAARRLFALAAARAEASGDLDAARAAWGTVLREVGAGDRAVAARDALVRLARSEDDPRRLLSALLESVEDAPDPAAQARRLEEAATLAAERLDVPSQAEALYRRARALAPGDEGLADRFVAFLSARGRWSEVDAELRARAAGKEPVERARLLLARAEVAERRLEDRVKAARLYVEAYRADPAPTSGRAAVEALARAGVHEEALALAEEVSATLGPDDPERGALQRARADVLEALGRVDEAADVLRAEIEHHTGSALLQERLRNLLARHRRFEALASFLQRVAEDLAPGEGLRTLLAAARIRVERLDDPAGARRALTSALGMVEGWLSAPGTPIPDEIAPLPAAGGQLVERTLFDAPLLDLASLAERIDTPAIRMAALRLYAQSLPAGLAQWRVLLLLAGAERESGDLDAAEFTLRGVVEAIRDADEVDPADRAEAERALGALLLDRGAAEDAVEALGRAAALLETAEADEDRAQVLVLLSAAQRAAGQLHQAVDALVQAHQLAPEAVPEADVDAAVEAAGPSPALAELEVRRAARVLVPSERAARLRHAAGIWEAIGRPDAAYGPLVAAYEADPSNAAEAARLEDLLYAAERWGPLASLLARRLEAENLTGEARRTVLLSRARLLEVQLSRPREAFELLEEAAASDPRPEVLLALARLARGLGEADTEQDALARLATVEPDPEARRAALVARARSLGTGAGGAAVCLEEAVELSLEHGLPVTPLAEALDRHYQARGDHASRARLWVRVAGVREGPGAAAAFARAGHVRLEALEDRRGAAAAVEASCRKAPGDLGLRRAALHIAESLGDARRAEAHARAGAEAALAQGRRVAAASFLRAQARGLAPAGRPDAELEVWARLLELDPDPAALDLIVTRAREGLSADKVEVLLAAAVGGAEDPAVKARLVRARARVLEEPLGRHWEAEGLRSDADVLDAPTEEAVEGAAPEEVEDEQAYRAQRSMLDRSGRWSELADLEERHASLAQSRVARARALLEVGRLHREAHEPEALVRAEDALGRAVRLDPGLVEAHGLRLEVQVEREDWAAADATAARLFELGGPGWAVPRLELLTAQVAEALGERDAALAAYARALARDPENPEALARRARMAPTPQHLEAWARSLDPVLDARTLAEVAEARARAALEAGDAAGALSRADEALAAWPGHTEGRALRRQALEALVEAGEGLVEPWVEALEEEAADLPPAAAADRLTRALTLTEAHGLRGRGAAAATALEGLLEALPARRDDLGAQLVRFYRWRGDGPAWLRALTLAGGVEALPDLTEAERSALGGALLAEGRSEEAWGVLVAGAELATPEGRAAWAPRVVEAILPGRGNGSGLVQPAVRTRLRQVLGGGVRGDAEVAALAAVVALLPRERRLAEALAEARVARGEGGAAAEVYRQLLAQDPARADVVRALAQAVEGAAEVCGPCAVRAWLESGRAPGTRLPRLVAPLSPEARGWLVADDAPLTEALQLGGRALSAELPPGFERPVEVRPADEDPRLAPVWAEVQAALPGAFSVYVDTEGGAQVVLEPGEVPTLAVGEALLEEASPEEVRFLVARAAFLADAGFLLSEWVPALARGEYLAGLADAAEHGEGPMAERLSPEARARLAELAPQLRQTTEVDLARWRAVLLRAADRFGLACAGDLAAALAAMDRLEPRAVGELRSTEAARVAAVRRWGPMADLVVWLTRTRFADLVGTEAFQPAASA